jgi:hypothetical protein
MMPGAPLNAALVMDLESSNLNKEIFRRVVSSAL